MDNEQQTPQHLFNLLLAENKQLKRKNENLESNIKFLEKAFSIELYNLSDYWQKDYTILQKKYDILMILCKKNINTKNE